nr:EOG090X05UC [Artemia franciscana]
MRLDIKKIVQVDSFTYLDSIVSKDEKPLAGVTVVDMTRVLAGPYCTMILGDLGADVIKIERPGLGDDTRSWGPPFIGSESCYFISINRNKRSICIDIKDKSGQKLVKELVKKSDVFVENFIPGTLDKLNLGYNQLSSIAPKLIYCSITGYGPDGCYKSRPGYDLIAASMGGLLSVTGMEDGDPCKVGVAMTDLSAGLYAHGAILAALIQRERTGKGQKIDINLLSTQLASMVNLGSCVLNSDVKPKKWGTAHENIVPYQCFKTKDGYITIAAGNDLQFHALCNRISAEYLWLNDKYRENRNRVVHRRELVAKLNDIFSGKSTKEWLHILEGSTFPYAPVNLIEDAFSDPHVSEIGIVKGISHPCGPIKVVGPPVKYSQSNNDIYLPPPLLGEHTNEILQQFLGYSSSEVNLLKEKGVVA